MAAESTKSRRWWAPIGLGAAICVACCLAPLLAAAGLAAGGVALLSVSWLEPLGIVLVVGGVVGMLWARSLSRRTGCSSQAGCGSAGDSNTTCGCTASATA